MEVTVKYLDEGGFYFVPVTLWWFYYDTVSSSYLPSYFPFRFLIILSRFYPCNYQWILLFYRVLKKKTGPTQDNIERRPLTLLLWTHSHPTSPLTRPFRFQGPRTAVHVLKWTGTRESLSSDRPGPEKPLHTGLSEQW